jgi:hypothetical protein
MFLVVYGELHFGKQHLYIKMPIQILALTLMVHNILLIEKVISIAFFLSPVTIILCSCHLLHIQVNQNVCTGSASATALRSCGVYFAGSSRAWHEPKETPSCSANSLMKSLICCHHIM